MRPYTIKLWLLLLGASALGVIVVVASKRHSGPSRCDPGWVNTGARCCALGQSLSAGHCTGEPTRCPLGFHRAQQASGCAYEARRIRVGGVALKIGPNDWQSEQVPRIEKQIGPLAVDATEVNNESWSNCVAVNRCPKKSLGEPGQPVVNVTLEDAQAFCAANGGRLPTLEERMALAAGNESRRYPWGQTGLVCRRATFGVVEGPCAEGGDQPDVTGCHTEGQSPEGILDLSGNVAELAVDEQHNSWSCGGSFRSKTALELKSWACSLFLGPTDSVGFRCVYELAGN